MSEEVPSNPSEGAPPPPPADPGPQTTPPPPAGSGDKTVMLVLAYLWLLALIPLLTEKEDGEVQWHAKNGILFTAAEIVFWIGLSIISSILPFIGCAIWPLAMIGILLVHILAIVKATRGERFRLPFVSDFVDQWK